jgi:acetyl esterase
MIIIKIKRSFLLVLCLALSAIAGEMSAKTISSTSQKELAEKQYSISLDTLMHGPAMKEIIYKNVGNEQIKLYYITPAIAKPGEKRAAIVWIHGGGWTGGSADSFFPQARYFATRDAVSFSINYRLVKVDGPGVADCLADCKSAIRYIRAHAGELGIDPDKIIVLGDSAGGHLASCLGTIDGFDDPSDNLKISAKVNAMVLLNPLSDFTTGNFIKTIIGGTALGKNPSADALKPSPEKMELARKLSPVFNVHKNQPPALVMHGLDDKVILPEQSERFAKAMIREGNRCDLILLPNTRHAFVAINYTATEEVVVSTIREIDKFLNSLGYLKGEPTLVVSKTPAWTPKVPINKN